MLTCDKISGYVNEKGLLEYNTWPFVLASQKITLQRGIIWSITDAWLCFRLRLKCDSTCAETRFRLSAKRTSPFKSAGASVQSTTGSRGVRRSGRNARCNMLRGSVKGTGYPPNSPVSSSLTLP
jgi:hypothetical protein